MHEYLLCLNQISNLISLSKKMNPYNYFPCWDYESTSSLSPLQGISWHQPPPPPAEPQNSTPYTSLEETQTGSHSNSRLHVTPATEELTIGSVATAEYGGEARNKKRKGKELENRNTCERKRRGRIAERMKTLEELLPNSSYKLSAASVLDKAIEYIKTLQLHLAVLGYQQMMMMDGLLIPTHNFPVGEDNSSDSILMANCGGIIPGINPSTHPGLSYNSDGLFSSVTQSMPDSEFPPQPHQSPIPGPLFDGFGDLLASAAASSPSLPPVSLPAGIVSSHLDSFVLDI